MSNFTQWMKTSYTLKFALTGVIILLLLIPANMVKGLIEERQRESEKVIRNISSKWGNEQTIAGPIINIPYKAIESTKNEKGETIYTATTGTLHFLPEQLDIWGNVTTDNKHYGIYQAVVYGTTLKLKGFFNKINLEELGVAPEDVYWDKSYISLNIPDLRGVNKRVILNVNGKAVEMNPGIANNDIFLSSYRPAHFEDRGGIRMATTDVTTTASGTSGLSAPVNVKDTGKTEFSIDLDINGSSSLYFIPIGKETNVSLTSAYTTPSFDGAFVTDTNVVNDKGFKASWKVLNLNRNFPQQWKNSAYAINDSAFGVNLLIPVDHYQKSMRSAKYAIMFIVLTFLVFLFAEMLNGFNIHPVQYLLVGFALILFYTLLLSISEQLGFTAAYLISSAAVILLISLYSKTIFHNNRLMALLSGILILLYGFLFVILRSEDYALLIGSIGLFIVLCVVMYLSRKIAWFGNEQQNEMI